MEVSRETERFERELDLASLYESYANHKTEPLKRRNIKINGSLRKISIIFSFYFFMFIEFFICEIFSSQIMIDQSMKNSYDVNHIELSQVTVKR